MHAGDAATGCNRPIEQGLDRLQKQSVRQAQEPGCGNEQEAHAEWPPSRCRASPTIRGRRCGPARGAVYEPPIALVRLTRVKPNPPEPLGRCQVHLDFVGAQSLRGRRPAGRQHQACRHVRPPVPGRLRLGAGARRRAERDRADAAPDAAGGERAGGHLGTPTSGITDDWYALYHGGHGDLSVDVKARDPKHPTGQPCGTNAELAVNLP